VKTLVNIFSLRGALLLYPSLSYGRWVFTFVYLTCADPNFFYTISVIKHGSSGVEICLYDHLSVSPAMAVGMDAPWNGRVQSPLSQFGQPRTTRRFSNHSSSRTQTRTTSFTFQLHSRRRDEWTITKTYVAKPMTIAQTKADKLMESTSGQTSTTLRYGGPRGTRIPSTASEGATAGAR